MKFTKMHGCGNDYVYINGAEEQIEYERKPELVRRLSDRHFGIGSDGVIFINPSDTADFEMEMWNADGTRAQMCGNGIRCVAKYVYDNRLTQKTEIFIESFGSVKQIRIFAENGLVRKVRVDMGVPVLLPEKIPVVMPEGPGDGRSGTEKSVTKESGERICRDLPVTVAGKEYRMTCVSMGNPHAVVFEDPDILEIEKIGPLFENHEAFPERTNTEFVKVLDRSSVRMRVWERGTGETLACGTGCCAVCAACVLNDLTDRKITVRVPGGELEIEWDEASGHIFMTGPAETVFTGEIRV